MEKIKNILLTNKKIVLTCLIAIILMVAGYVIYFKPVAYINIDINPSIELGINRFDKVVTKTSYNKEGEELLKDLSLYSMNLSEFVSEYFEKIIENSYIKADGKTLILITSITDDEKLSGLIFAKANVQLQKVLKDKNKTAIIYQKELAFSYHKKAKEANISAGKLDLIEQLKKEDKTTNLKNFQNTSLDTIFGELNKYYEIDTTSGATSTKGNNSNAGSTDAVSGATSTTGGNSSGNLNPGTDTVTGATASPGNSNGGKPEKEVENEDEYEDEEEDED